MPNLNKIHCQTEYQLRVKIQELLILLHAALGFVERGSRRKREKNTWNNELGETTLKEKPGINTKGFCSLVGFNENSTASVSFAGGDN